MRALVAILAAVALAGAGIALAARDRKPGKPPVVFVVLDALSTSMLMKPGGQIDAERYPGFASLARASTWYPNATTVHDSTIKSVPAMLDGRWPSNRRRPLVGDHPVNLFTLLRGGYRVHADEEGTQLCPPTVCRQERARLLHLLHSDRERRFDEALARIRRQREGERPGLWFMHVLLPHEPLRFLPSGKVYEGGSDPEPGLDGNESFHVEFLTRQAEQRHLLQLRFTDTLIQRLERRLRQTGLWDDALVVVTADHGMSFRVKRSPAEPYRRGQIGWRRDLTPRNAHDVAFVPLFVKGPGQKRGAVDRSWARTVDILPTILRAAGAEDEPRALIGRALGAQRGRPAELQVLTNRRGLVRLRPAAMERARERTVAERAARFGVGSDVEQMFRVGPRPELIGRPLTAFRPAPARGLRARFWGPHRFRAVDLSRRSIPANVIGWLEGGAPAGRDLALAVNGRIAAVGRSFEPMGSSGMTFSLMVPESAFRDGGNDVRLYEVRAGRLAELGRPTR